MNKPYGRIKEGNALRAIGRRADKEVHGPTALNWPTSSSASAERLALAAGACGQGGRSRLALYAPLAYTGSLALLPITVIEVQPFPSKADRVWSEEERLEFISFIAYNPMAGDVIPGTGGVRKVRWARQGKGKRGGVRVVYYFHDASMPLFLITVYAKSRKDDLSPDELQVIKKLAAELRSSYGKG